MQTLFSVNTDNLRNIFDQKKPLFKMIIWSSGEKIVILIKTTIIPVGPNNNKSDRVKTNLSTGQNMNRAWTEPGPSLDQT